ncbi:MAG: tetratricopeptide (TPR) repeat protein [Myxococcota bacterium]|jgi:tetratricopeptide (TPR) repeat protein
MGFLSWLFPSESDRVAKAQALMERGAWADARLEVLDIASGDARLIVEAAEKELALQNLNAAISWATAGDDERIQVHLELAEQFKKPGMDDAFRENLKKIRDIRAGRSAEDALRDQEKAARLNSVDPLGLSGSTTLLPSPPGMNLTEEEHIELEARVGLLIENYPDVLRDSVGELDANFAQAVIDLEDGNAADALQGLLAQPDNHALVCWERARAAQALGDPLAAARSLRRFADLAGGHHTIGRAHTGVLLSQLTAETGDVAEALRILRAVRSQDADLGTGLFAALLEATDELEDAETVLLAAVKKHPKALAFYSLLARVRLKGGHRIAAMTALERAMDQCACGTGKCGSVPMDAGIVRTLATLYFEDGMEPERAAELAGQAAGLVQKPMFEDAYLSALAGRARQDPGVEPLVQQLHTAVVDDDPRRSLLDRHLPLAS